MQLRASVTKKGAVLLGKYVACDGFHAATPLRVVTHAHADHLMGLRKSLKECKVVIMTPATKGFIDALKGPSFLTAGNVRPLEYGTTLVYKDERVSLHYVDHILGSAQVLVEETDGTRILYTSDFRLPKTPIIEADVLVMEATYGNPYRVRPFWERVENVLVSLVEDCLKFGPVYLFGYHGKLQEVMQLLYDAKVRVPFIVSERVLRVSEACERHGMRFGESLLLSGGEKASSILQEGGPCVAFHHMNSRRKVGKDSFRVYVSGWQFSSPCRQVGEKEFRVALSDHSDFDGLLGYVKRCKPKMVITDNYREGDAVALAREIYERLGIPAKPLPT
jgi:putative mRNA 3-end processing factor